MNAVNEEPLIGLLKKRDWKLIGSFKSKYIQRLKQYYFVGGMPEAVLSFSKQTDFEKVRTIQKQILAAYEQDFSKHVPNGIVPRIRMLWNTLPAQLAKENKKFIYGIIRKGARVNYGFLSLAKMVDFKPLVFYCLFVFTDSDITVNHNLYFKNFEMRQSNNYKRTISFPKGSVFPIRREVHSANIYIVILLQQCL